VKNENVFAELMDNRKVLLSRSRLTNASLYEVGGQYRRNKVEEIRTSNLKAKELNGH